MADERDAIYTGATTDIDEEHTRPETWKDRAQKEAARFIFVKRRAEEAETQLAVANNKIAELEREAAPPSISEREKVLEAALHRIAEEGTTEDLERVGDAYSDTGWTTLTNVHPLAQIALDAIASLEEK